MLQAANNEGGFSRGSLKTGGATHTIEMSRDVSPVSPNVYDQKRRLKGGIGVEKIQIISET
jgi:hypothetical protein